MQDVTTSDRTIRNAGTFTGIGLLAMSALSVYGLLTVIPDLVVDGNASRTAANIAEHATGFRLAVASVALVALLDVVVAWGLWVVFAPTSAVLSAVQAVIRIAYGAMFMTGAAHLAIASQLLSREPGRSGFGAEELAAQALLQIDTFNAIWSAGLMLCGLHLILVAYLVIKSAYAPTWIGLLLIPAGAGYIFDSFGDIVVRDYSLSIGSITFVGEALLMLWLLVRGRRMRISAVG